MKTMRKILAVVSCAAFSAVAFPAYAQQDKKVDCWKQHRDFEKYARCVAAQMEPIDPARRDHFGEEYGAEKYLKCALSHPPRDTYCDRHRLKRRPEPEYWPNADRVPPPNWPAAPKETVYRKGMKPKEYFKALCKAEAGEFIYRTVQGVEGIYQIRPRLRATDYELRDRYVMEDPYGYSTGEASEPQNYFVQPPLGKYQYLEVPRIRADGSLGYARFYRGEPIPGKTTQYMEKRADGNFTGKVAPYVVHEAQAAGVTAKYGYAWRGIVRPHDRENSIAGGELYVIDLQTNEILGVRRGFAMTRTRHSKYGPNWEVASECPPHVLGSKDYRFIEKVIVPTKD